MKQGRRFGFSAEQKLDVWRRWNAGQTLPENIPPFVQVSEELAAFAGSQSEAVE